MIPQNQGSSAWLEWRKDKITATDAGIIMGLNPYKSFLELFDQKLGIVPPDEENDHMRRGKDLEDQARDAFEAETGFMVFPQVCVHSANPWMCASFDGLSLDKKIGVEIKCPTEANFRKIVDRHDIPVYHLAQMQHQMAVANLDHAYYFLFHVDTFDEQHTNCIKIDRDDQFIEKIIEKEKLFYDILLKFKQIREDYYLAYDNIKSELCNILGSNEERIS